MSAGCNSGGRRRLSEVQPAIGGPARSRVTSTPQPADLRPIAPLTVEFEFEVEGGPHVCGAYDARRGVVLPSHPPQFLAFGEGHLDPAVAAGNGAFDRDFSGHFPNIATTARGRGTGMRAGCSASTFILVAAWEQSLHPGSPGQRLAHRKGPLNAENAVRTTGVLTAGRNRGTEQAPPANR